MLAPALTLSLLLAAPAAADASVAVEPAVGADQGDVVEVQDEEEEGIFDNVMERRFAFSMNDDLHPSVADDTLPFFLGGIFCCVGGQVWLPLLMIDDAPEDYLKEAIITWLFYIIPGFLLTVPAYIPYVNFIYGPIYCLGSLAIHFYLLPVNLINTWDRQAKKYGMEAPKKKRKKKKSSSLGLPEDDRFALAEPQMAY